MAIQDTPVKRGQQKMVDAPVKSRPVSTSSQEREAFETAQASFLDNYVSGNSVLENYNYYAGVRDKARELQKLASQKASQDAQDVSEEFVLNPYGTSGSIQEQAQQVAEARREVLKGATDTDKQFTETLVGTEYDKEAVDKQSANAKMYKVLSDAQAEVDGWDIGMDIMSGFVPFLESYKGYALTGQYFNQDDEIKRAIYAFQKLPPEEQASLFPQIKTELEEKLGKAGGVQMLGQFLEPMGAEQDQRFGDINKVFDAIDATGVGALANLFFKGAKGSYNVAKAAKAVGNDDLAKDTSVAAALDADYARAAGMDSTTATGNILPFDTSIEDIGHTGGLSGRALDDLDEYFGRVDRTAEDIIAGKGFLKEGIVNTRRRAELEAEAEQMLKADKAEDITVKSKDLNQTTYSYKIRDEDGDLIDQEYTLSMTLNDVGHWDQSTMSLVGEYLGSPTAFAKGTLKEDVATAQRIDYLSSRINKQLFDLTRDALKPIGLVPTPKNRESLAKVDNALIQGDEWKNADGTRGKVFTPDELRENFSLEDNEISAYYRINRLYNNLFNIRNHEKRQEMVALGYKNINLTRSDESLAGKVFETANDAALSARQRSINYVYDADADELVNIKNNEGFFKGAYDEGKRITRVEEPYNIGGDRGSVYYIMTSADDVTELPQTVLRRKAGYVPRVYEDNAYFVKEIKERVVDGDKTWNDEKTLRFFSNKREADEYIEQLVKKDVARGIPEETARKKYQRREDREQEILSAATGDIGHGSGGLYTGARAQDDILFGLEGTKPNRLNSFESLTRNIGNVSKFASINQWRMGLEQRWINTANNLFKAKGLNNRVEGFERLSSIAEANDEVRFLNRMYDQIRDWQQFPTAEERAWSNMVQKTYDWAANRGYNRTAKMLGNLRGTDPISTARATAFHSLLGWFNFSQLWVQAQGAMVAASLSAGKYFNRTMFNSLGLASLDAAGKNADSIIPAISRAAGIPEDEMRAIHELWSKTGYRDSVLQTADHAAASKGYGMSMDLFKRASDSGLIFYRTGELTNRRLSFTTAIERFKENNSLDSIKGISDDQLKTIMDDANNMMLNMSRANRAQWQKGFLSLPTQFLQVTTKFLETAGGFNRQFDGAERGRLIASQLLLYGTAGVPVAGLGTKFAMEAMGITQKQIEENPGLVKTWNDGFWGATTHWVFGADIELASRGSLLRGVGDFIDNWFVQEATVASKLLGAFGSTGTRFWDSFTHHIKPFTLGGMENVDWEDAFDLVTSPVFDTISTFRNIEKAAYMERLDAIYSANGRQMDDHDFSYTEEIAMRMGFQPTRDTETWDIIQRDKANQSMKRKIQEYVMKRMNEFALEYPDGNYPDSAYNKYKRDIQAATMVLDPSEQDEMRESIFQSMDSGSRRTQAVQRYMQSMKQNTATDLENWRATLLGNGVLRLGIETEEQE